MKCKIMFEGTHCTRGDAPSRTVYTADVNEVYCNKRNINQIGSINNLHTECFNLTFVNTEKDGIERVGYTHEIFIQRVFPSKIDSLVNDINEFFKNDELLSYKTTFTIPSMNAMQHLTITKEE